MCGIVDPAEVAGLFPKKRNTITLRETVEKASHWIRLMREDTSWSEVLMVDKKGTQLNWRGDLTSVRGLGAS